MSKPLDLIHVKTTPKAFGVFVEWKWPDPVSDVKALELQYVYSDGQLGGQEISHPVNGVIIGGLKSGEVIQLRIRTIPKVGDAEEWDCHHWIKGQACIYAYAGTTLDDLRVEIADASIALGSINPGPTKTYIGELSVGINVEDKSIMKATLSGVLNDYLPTQPPSQIIYAARTAADAVKEAFSRLDKDSASQS